MDLACNAVPDAVMAKMAAQWFAALRAVDVSRNNIGPRTMHHFVGILDRPTCQLQVQVLQCYSAKCLVVVVAVVLTANTETSKKRKVFFFYYI